MCSLSRRVALLLYYQKFNRYSFNALVGAIEVTESLDYLPIFFAETSQKLMGMLDGLLERFDRVVVAFSFMTCQLFEVMKVVHSVRRKYSSRPILVAGGPHPTGDPKGTLELGFDIVVRGEGEKVFPQLLEKVMFGLDYASLRSVAFFDGKDYVVNPLAEKPDINCYPPFAVKHKRFGPIEISRGCPWACRFCQTPFIFGVKVRHRSVQNICKYVEIMRKEGLTDIRFISPNAFMYGSSDGKSVNVSAIEELLSSVRKALGNRGRIFFGTFPSEVRPECVTTEVLELIKKYCNNDNIVIGAQSGSDRLLDYIGRGHSVEDIRRAVELTLKSGLKVNVDFIFGLPGETEEDIELTVKLIKELAAMGARIHAHTFMPLVGTPFKDKPPGRINSKLRRELERLISAGKLYGQWQTQELIAKRISELRKKGIIKDCGSP